MYPTVSWWGRGDTKNMIKTYSILEGYNGKKEKQESKGDQGPEDFEGQIIKLVVSLRR